MIQFFARLNKTFRAAGFGFLYQDISNKKFP